MACSEKTIDLHVAGYSTHRATATVTLREYDSRERLFRASKAAGICWAITLLGVLIPLAHFFIVPGGTVLGIYLFVTRYRARVVPENCRGKCPDCQMEQDFDVGPQWALPATISCEGCHRSLTLSQKP